MGARIQSHTELEVYRQAFGAAMEVFRAPQGFPREELYSLTDQMRRSSRSVCANIAEGWRKRRYEKAFVSKLNEAEGEAAETQVWLEFSVKCGYLTPEEATPLYQTYDGIIRLLVSIFHHADQWILR